MSNQEDGNKINQNANQEQTPPPSPSEAGAAGSDKDARMWAMFCHLAALLAVFGIPFANIIGPLVIWLIKREADPFIDQNGKESLNFQISMTIYSAIAGLLIFVLIGIPLLILIIIADLILVIIASVKTNNGEHYRYPLTIRLLK